MRCRSLITLLALLPVLAATGVRSAESKNLVRNGSLEEPVAEGALPDGWTAFQQPAAGYTMRVVGQARTGKHGLSISGEGDWGGVAVHRVPIAEGRQYAVRGWVKLEGDEAARGIVKLDYFNEAGEWIVSSPHDVQVQPGPGWQLVSMVSHRSHAPGAKSVGLAVAVTGKARGLFDDLEMVEREAAPDPLLRNGDMEVIAGAAPFGYTVYTAEGGKATVSWTDRAPRTGWYALRLKGNAEWAVALDERLPVQKGKTYILKGFARAASGTAVIKFDYFKDGEYLGQSASDGMTGNEWTELKAISELDQYPTATHLAAVVVGSGDMDCDFDALTLTVK